MRVLMFQPRFAALVAAGTKRQTIRASARCVAGDVLSLRRWTGAAYRSKQEVIREESCTSVRPIFLDEYEVVLDNERVDPGNMALADGFACWEEMRDWFRAQHALPFYGWVISWEPAKGSKP